MKGIKIRYTFLNIVSIKNLKKRLNKRKNLNKYDRFNRIFYNQVQKGFISLANKKSKYLIVNSNNDINYNKKMIINKIEKIIFN